MRLINYLKYKIAQISNGKYSEREIEAIYSLKEYIESKLLIGNSNHIILNKYIVKELLEAINNKSK